MNGPSVLVEPTPSAQPHADGTAGCTLLVPNHSVHVPASAFTMEGFRAWAKSGAVPENARVAFLDNQVLIDMTAEELQNHNLLKAAIYGGLLPWNVARDLGLFFPDGALVTHVGAGISNIPDGVFALWASLEAGRVRLVPTEAEPSRYLELEGTPDWVMEIVSDSSVQKDTQTLREAYHRAHIPEYWLIDARGERIDFQILRYQAMGYVAANRRGGWQRSRIFGCQCRLLRERGRLGLWQYTLQLKPFRPT